MATVSQIVILDKKPFVERCRWKILQRELFCRLPHSPIHEDKKSKFFVVPSCF